MRKVRYGTLRFSCGWIIFNNGQRFSLSRVVARIIRIVQNNTVNYNYNLRYGNKKKYSEITTTAFLFFFGYLLALFL